MIRFEAQLSCWLYTFYGPSKGHLSVLSKHVLQREGRRENVPLPKMSRKPRKKTNIHPTAACTHACMVFSNYFVLQLSRSSHGQLTEDQWTDRQATRNGIRGESVPTMHVRTYIYLHASRMQTICFVGYHFKSSFSIQQKPFL